MFKKLLSNLPFNPSLINQVNFYAKRLRAEASIRRLSAGILVLALGLQIFAATLPNEPTLAASNNDILFGGARDKGDMVNKCNRNERNFQTILQHFGIDCLRVYASTETQINSNDYGRQLYSLGRISYGFAGETPVAIAGTTYFMRPLRAWDSNPATGSTYRALKGTRLDGTPFMILLDCANVVIIGPPTQPPPPPPPPPPLGVACSNIVMSVRDNAVIKVGSTIRLRGQAVGRNIAPNDTVGMYYQFVDAKTNTVISEKKGLGIPFSGSTAQDPVQREFKITTAGNYIFRLTVKYDGGSKVATGSRAGNCKKEVKAKDQPCKDVDSGDIAQCIEQHKKVTNTTQNIPDANGTTAKPGDDLTYTLVVKNTSTNTVAKNYVFEENIGDILDYAEVTNYHGGTNSSDNTVKWAPVSIQPGQTIERKISVRIKSNIPQTPSPSTNPGSFDCRITNVFGDITDINIPCSTIKTVEQVTTSLPNTGPGETIAFAFTITTIAGYFFARSKLMAKELDIVRTDYRLSGGN